MALIKCSECKHEVSTQAKKCPNCGAPVKQELSAIHITGIVFFGGFFLMLLIAGMQESEPDSQEVEVVAFTPAKKAPPTDATDPSNWDWSSQQEELDKIKNTVAEIKPTKTIGLSSSQKADLEKLKKGIKALIKKGQIIKLTDNETSARILIDPIVWENTLHEDRINVATRLFQYFNMLHINNQQQPIEFVVLRNAYNNDSLAVYNREFGYSD